MEIVNIKIDKLKPAEYNPRLDLQPEDKEYQDIKRSIVEFGLVEPLIINGAKGREGIIIGGHQRLKVLRDFNYSTIPCIIVHLEKTKEKLLNIALNKISGDWDRPKLKDLLEELDTGEWDLNITGWDEQEIESLMTEFHLEEEDDFDVDKAIEEAKEPICKEGNLWQLGEHRLLCGDAKIEKDVKRLMDGKKADCVYCDPPYGMGLDTDWSKAKSKLKFYKEKGCKGGGNKYNKVIGDNEDFETILIKTIFNNFVYCKELFLWGADYYTELLLNKNDGNWFVWDKRSNEGTDIEYVKRSDKMYGSCFELCWSKKKHKREIIRVKWAGVFGTEREPDKNKSRLHPTQKPVLLSNWFIGKFSKKDNIIVDLFGGSGSTLIACEQLNRKCYMMEIDPIYCDVIIKRWEEYTNKEAVLIK